MKIAIVAKDGKVSEMDEGNVAEIYEDKIKINSIQLNDHEDHPGLQKMTEILRAASDVDAIITKSCGPPCVRLARNRGKEIFFFDGNILDAEKNIIEGRLKPVTEDDAFRMHRGHGHHHNHE